MLLPPEVSKPRGKEDGGFITGKSLVETWRDLEIDANMQGEQGGGKEGGNV